MSAPYTTVCLVLAKSAICILYIPINVWFWPTLLKMHLQLLSQKARTCLLCTHARAHARTHAPALSHVRTFRFIQTGKNNTDTDTRPCMHVHPHVHSHSPTYTCTYMHILYTHKHTHAHTHRHEHRHTQAHTSTHTHSSTNHKRTHTHTHDPTGLHLLTTRSS